MQGGGVCALTGWEEESKYIDGCGTSERKTEVYIISLIRH
jgi:hypothetical protein